MNKILLNDNIDYYYTTQNTRLRIKGRRCSSHNKAYMYCRERGL